MQAITSATVAEMEDFVSLAAHDLRSPIANVKTLADLIREDFVDMGDGKLEMLGMIEEISTRALALVSDVMALAAAANARSDLRNFDLRALCEDILVTLDPARLHVVTVPQLHLNADYIAIQIILRNLIDNALKHSKAERTALEISVTAQGPHRIEVTVKDDGTGFADPALAFLDGGALGVDSGFGLLGIRRLVRARGGVISAVSPSSGRGAEVQFQLPGQILPNMQAVGALATTLDAAVSEGATAR
ncbi:sensor histidine kinase [Tateyamaria sp.]|uniref:sensor histidine kinase n=1 Tax=Tateyamaria sp. TaxID=1929288 RepID=UPI003B2228A9